MFRFGGGVGSWKRDRLGIIGIRVWWYRSRLRAKEIGEASADEGKEVGNAACD